jgi:hypothetical protein
MSFPRMQDLETSGPMLVDYHYHTRRSVKARLWVQHSDGDVADGECVQAAIPDR